jgi:hypothetical protein
MTDFAPYLARITPQSRLLEELVRNGWGKSWGVYITAKTSFDELRHHFRRFLMVKTEDGTQLYFRFYDPRVLRSFLPTCTREEARQFFGPVRWFLMEGDKPEILMHFSLTPQGVAHQAIPLVNGANEVSGYAAR